MPAFDLDILRQLFLSIGGPVMGALVLVSIVALATSLIKVMEFRRLGVGSHKRAERALKLWADGDRKAAFETVEMHKAALSRVAAETMRSVGWVPDQIDAARDAGLATASELLAAMGRRLRLLETIVQAAPMLGLLGTVLGMIDAFGALASSGGVGDPGQLAGGIWLALSTTAVGLAIAIPFYFVASWLEERIEAERTAMEAAISKIVTKARRPYLASGSKSTGPQAPSRSAERLRDVEVG
jgi:biopolymer transport protein ExbB